MTKWVNVAACGAVILCASALGAQANKPVSEPNKPMATQAKDNKKMVAVIINGQEITEEQIDAMMAPQLARIASQVPPNFIDQYKAQLRSQVLERMIAEKLLDEEVKKENITVSDKDVNDQITQIASKQNLTMSDLKALIKASGQSFEQVQSNIKRGLGYQKLIQAQFAGKINITPEDVNKYYKDNKAEFVKQEEVRASHILITSDANAKDPNAAKAKAKAKAQELLEKIKGGADFAELAKANSKCPSAAKGGDLGFFSKGKMVPEFENAAFKLNVGQVSDVVETSFGYHIIKVTDKKAPGTITFEQAKNDIMGKLQQQKESELTYNYIESLRAKAKIVYPGKEAEQVNEPIVEGVTVGDLDSNKPKK